MVSEDGKEKIKYQIYGESSPTADELIDILNGLKTMLPNPQRKSFRIEEIKKGSIIIDAVIKLVSNLFGQEEFSIFWDNLDKILMLFEASGIAYTGYKKVVEKIEKKPNLNMDDVKELLELLNEDKNSIGSIIRHEDFKDLRKISEIVKTRGNMVVTRASSDSKIITKEVASIIIKVADADLMEDENPEIISETLHLKMIRVSFEGTEQWKARILEHDNRKLEYIEIEDIFLQQKIKNGDLSFTGQEVIEAIVRIESKLGKNKYFLEKYIDIAPIQKIIIK